MLLSSEEVRNGRPAAVSDSARYAMMEENMRGSDRKSGETPPSTAGMTPPAGPDTITGAPVMQILQLDGG